MKNTILAAAAVLTMALSVAPGFAAAQNGATTGNGSSNVFNNCASIRASHDGHSQADVQYCEAQQ